MIEAKDIITNIQPIVHGERVGDIVRALMTAAASLTQMTSEEIGAGLAEEDFVESARFVWRRCTEHVQGRALNEGSQT